MSLPQRTLDALRSPEALRSTVMILELDSVRQAEYFDKAAHPLEAVSKITGMIRTALLVSEELTITDSMLLDGMYFAHMPPQQLAQALGVHVHDLPLQVLCSDETLDESLKTKWMREDFIWQLRSRLPEERLGSHWAAWTDPVLDLRIGSFRTMANLPVPDERWAARLSERSRALLDSISITKRRSVAHAAISAAVVADPGETGIEQVARWWNHRYLVAIAEANDADWLRFDDTAIDANGLSAYDRRSRRRLRIPLGMVDTARKVNGPMFGTLRYRTENARRGVTTRPSGYRMRNLSWAVTRLTEQPSRATALWSATVRLIFAALAVLISLPYLNLTFLGLDVAWVAFGTLVLTTVPFDAVFMVTGTFLQHGQPLLSSRVKMDAGEL